MSMGDECGAADGSEKELDSVCCDRIRDSDQRSSSAGQMEKKCISVSAASDTPRGINSARTSSSTASSPSEMIQQPDFRSMRDMPSNLSLFLDHATVAVNRMSNEERKLFYDGYAAGIAALEPYADMLAPDLEEGVSVLSLAASAGYCDLVQVLLSSMRMCPDERGTKGDCTPLMEAASAGHTDIVRCLIEHGADVNAHSSVGNTPLIYACAAGHEEAVRVLLDGGADVDLCNDNGQSPLMEAAAAGHLGIAKLLVEHGARVNFVCTDLKVGLETPLTLACYKGHTEMVDFLLKAGSESYSPGRDEELHTALMEASMDGHVEVATLLLEAGAQVNLAADTFESPLTLAACGGHVELAKLLLSKGARLEEINDEGYTPLMEAAREGHLDVVRLLVEHGSDVNMLTDETGETALTLAAAGNFRDIVAYLLSKGAIIELGACTPLMEAAQEGNYETLSYLLSSGANVHAVTTANETALSYAAESGHTKICEALLAAGAVLEHPGDTGRTPLMKAAAAGHRETVEFLLRKGANPNLCTTDNDHNALSLACINCHIPVVDLLLQNGADPKLRLKDGSTCFIEAAKSGQTRVVQYLLDWPESSGSSIQYSSCCVIPPPPTIIHGVPPVSDAEVAAAINNGLLLPPFTMPSSGEAVQAILANGSCTTTMMTANTISRGVPLVVTPLTDYVGTIPTGSLPPYNIPNLAVAHEGAMYCPGVPQMDGKKMKNLCATLSRAANGDDPTATDLKLMQETLKLQLQESTCHFGGTGQSKSTATEEGESGCKSVKSRKAELDAAVRELEQLKKTQKMYENLKKMLGTHKSCANVTAAFCDRDCGCFAPETVVPDCKHLYETPCYRQFMIDSMDANMAVTSAADISTMPKMELYPASADGQTDSSQIQFLHQHVNVVLPVAHSCPGQQQSLSCNLVASKEDNIGFTPTVSVAMVSVTASEAAAIYRNNSRFGFSGNVMPLEGVPAPASGIVPANCAVANGEKLYIPVQLAQQDVNSAMFHGFSAGAIPTLGSLPQGVIPVQTTPAGTVVAVPTVAVNNVNALPLFTSRALATSVVTNTITTKTAVSGQTAVTEADNKSTQTPCIFLSQPTNNDCTKNDDDPALAKPNVPPRPFAQDLELETEGNHDTALTLAVAAGHDELVTFLLQRGANIEHRDKKGYTPLIVAVNSGNQKVIELLIANGANLEAQTDRTKETALSIACQIGRRDVAEILLKHNANKEHRNVSDYTPLCLAAAGGCTDVMELLLQHGAEINSRSGSKLGISPLMLAAMNGNAAAVKFLIDHGADINAQIETNRNTALTLACFQGKPDVVRILVEHRANVEHRAKTGLTPLMEAASGGFVEVGHVLLQAGADPNCTPVPSSRDTCLTIAADKGHNSFVDLLLQYTNQVDCRTKKGYTALWLAAHGGHQECVYSLIEAGADVDMPDNRRITPLMAAFRRGHIEVVKCLVDHVTQFPSDQDLARYHLSITDKEVKQKCAMAVGIITLAKDRQAQMANKVAAGLLMEIEQEQQIAETRRQAKLRKKEKNRQKRLKKKAAAQQQQSQETTTNGDEELEDDDDEGKAVTRSESNDSLTAQSAATKVAAEERFSEEREPRRTVNSSQSSSRLSSYSISPERRSCQATSIRAPAQLQVEDDNESQRVPNCADTHSEDAASKSSEADFIPVLSHDNRVRSSQVIERKIRRRRLRRPRLNEPIVQTKNQTVQKSARHSSSAISTSLSNTAGAANRQMPLLSANSRLLGGKASNEATSYSKSFRNLARDEVAAPCDGGGGDSSRSVRSKTVHQSRSREETQDSSNGTLTWREVRRQPHKLFVSAQAIARVIGRGGQNINAIREASGAHIEVEKQQRGQADRLVTIKGSSEATKQAVYMINGLINEPESHVNTIINKVRSKDRKALESFAHAKPSGSSSSTSNGGSSRSSTKADKGGGGFPEVTLWVPTTTTASSATPTKSAVTTSTPPATSSTVSGISFVSNGSTNAWTQKPSVQTPKMNYASVAASSPMPAGTNSAGQMLKVENDGGMFVDQNSPAACRNKSNRFRSSTDVQWGYSGRGDVLSGLKANNNETHLSTNDWAGGTTGPLCSEKQTDLSAAKTTAEPISLSIASNGTMLSYPYSTGVNYPSGPLSAVSQKGAVSYPNPVDVDNNGRHSAGGNSIALSSQGFCSPSAVQRPASATASIESGALLGGRLKQVEHTLNSADFASDTLSHETTYPMPIGGERRLKSSAGGASSGNPAATKATTMCTQSQSALTSVESTASSLMSELFLSHCDQPWNVDRPTENGCKDGEKTDWSIPFGGGSRFSTEWSSITPFDSNVSSRPFGFDYSSGSNSGPIETADVLHQQTMAYGSSSLQHQQQPHHHAPLPPPPVSGPPLIPPPPYFSPNIPPPPVMPTRIKFVPPGYINGSGYPGESMPPSARNLAMGFGYCPPPVLPSRPPSDVWSGPARRIGGHLPSNNGDWKISNGSAVPHGPPMPPPPHAQHPPPSAPPPNGSWGGWNSLPM
uniref:ANK_REP_REGION domain-containing protein n=1 Tax=Trichuris muris TaxID=70415 RepID=A0A5S6QY69_TRIMR